MLFIKLLYRNIFFLPYMFFLFSSSRNYKFEVNFGKTAICEKDEAERPHYTIKDEGEDKEPWFSAMEGYTFVALAESKIGNVPR